MLRGMSHFVNVGQLLLKEFKTMSLFGHPDMTKYGPEHSANVPSKLYRKHRNKNKPFEQSLSGCPQIQVGRRRHLRAASRYWPSRRYGYDRPKTAIFKWGSKSAR